MTEIKADTSTLVDRVVSLFNEAIPAERGGSLAEVRKGYEAVLAQLPIPDDASITSGTYGGVGGYWVQATDASNGRIGVMLHGGGYVMGSAKGYRAFAAEVARATKSRVFVAEYRLAPEHPFPAALEDASSVLTAAIDEVGSQSVFAIGDSAGGGLVVSSLWELHRKQAPLPACIVLVSALLDLTATNPSYEELADVDPICSRAGIRHNASLYLDGQGQDNAPAAFPMLSDLGWLPKCLLLVGGAEVLRDDSRNLADKLEREGGHAEYREYDDMVHVWPLFSSFIPQGKEALKDIGAFVRAAVARTSQNQPTGT